MFTEQTLNGEQRASRAQGSEAEVKSVRDKAIKLKLFIYNKKVHDSIVKVIKAGAEKPVQTIGKLAAELIAKFEKDGAGIINDPDILEGLSKALITELITISAASGILSEEQVNSDLLFRIVGMAQVEWDKLNPDRVDKGRAQRMMDKGRQDPAMVEAAGRSAQEKSIGGMGRKPDEQAPQQNQQQAPQQAQQQPPLEPM